MRILKIREGVRYEQEERHPIVDGSFRRDAIDNPQRAERDRGIYLIADRPGRAKAFPVES